jgi:hypothetical protein
MVSSGSQLIPTGAIPMKWPAKWALVLLGGLLAVYVARNGSPPPPPAASVEQPSAPEPTAATAPNPPAASRHSAHTRDLTAAAKRALDAFCGLNLHYIEALFDAVHTTCRIVGYRHSLMILFTAEGPVFSVPAARKAWAAAVVITAGKTIRDMGGYLIGLDYVGLTDSEQAKSGKVARFSASFAEQLQAAIHDGKVDAIAAVDDLDRRLQR